MTSTIPSWFRRYGNQRCYFWSFFLATRQTQNMLCSYILDQVYFPNAKEAEFQYVTVPNLLLSIKPLGQILYMLRSQFSCKHHNHIPKSLSPYKHRVRRLGLDTSGPRVLISMKNNLVKNKPCYNFDKSM